MEYYKKKKQEPHAVHLVLAERCHQMDSSSEKMDIPSDEIEIFQAVL